MKKHMNLINMYRSIGMIPASYKVAMTYEEQLLWLCNYIQEVATEVATEVTKLTSQLVLNGTCDLPTGLYTTDSYNVYLGSATLENLILGVYQLFYFDNDTQTLTGGIASYYYDSGSWNIMEHNYITNEINDNRSQIPTSQAVNRLSWQFENFDKILANRLTMYINQYDDLAQNTIYNIENAVVGEIYTPSISISTNEAAIGDTMVLGEQYSITGDFEYVLCDTTGKVLIKESGTGTALDPYYISPLHRRLTDPDYKIYINLTNTQDPYSIYKAIFIEPIEKVYATSKSYQIPNAKDMFENLNGNRKFTKNVGLKLSTNYTYVDGRFADFNSNYKYDFSGYSIGDTFNPVNVSEAGAGNGSISVKLCEYLAFGGNGVVYNYAICNLNNVILDFGTITGTTIPTILSPLNEGYEQDLIFYIWTPTYSSIAVGLGTLLIPSRSLTSYNDHLHFPSNYAVKDYVDSSISNLPTPITNETNGTTSSVSKIWTGTQIEYTALGTYDSTTLYFIKE